MGQAKRKGTFDERLAAALSRSDPIERIESALLQLDQVECPLIHRFAPGVYLREILMRVPEGEKFLFVIGQKHKTKHFNVILKGRVRVAQIADDGSVDESSVHEIVAPCSFVSEAGVRKVLCVMEDTIWQTVHATEETDLRLLREQLIEESPAFKRHAIGEIKKAICEN